MYMLSVLCSTCCYYIVRKYIPGAGEMCKSALCLLCKHDARRSDSQNLSKKPSVKAYTLVISALNRQRQEDAQGLLVS